MPGPTISAPQGSALASDQVMVNKGIFSTVVRVHVNLALTTVRRTTPRPLRFQVLSRGDANG